MHKDRFYIREVLEELCSTFPYTTYAEHRPSAMPQHDEFLVVSVPTYIADTVVHRGVVRIEIMVRNLSNGKSNTKRLNEILSDVVDMFPVTNRRFSLCRPQLVLSGDDGLGFTIWYVQADLKVNTTDNYDY